MLLFLFLLSSCGSCGPKPAPPKETNTKKTPTTPVEKAKASGPEQMSARVRSVITLRGHETFDTNLKDFLSASAPEDAAPPKGAERVPAEVLNMKQVLLDHIGAQAAPHLRPDGTSTLTFFTGEPSWMFVVPVRDPVDFFKKMNAAEDPTEVGLVTIKDGDAVLYANKRQIPTIDGISEGARIAISPWREAAIHAEAFLKKATRDHKADMVVELWPRRLGYNERSARNAQELRLRLSAMGHALMPARASLIHLQSNLYAALGDPANWPERVQLHMTFKIRSNKSKALRAYLEVPATGVRTLETLHEALTPRKGASPPSLKGALGTVTLRLDRSSLEEAFEAILPRAWRMTLAARGEDAMTALSVVALDALEHNRGATTIGVYEQKYPLSGETMLAFEAMDVERLQASLDRFQKAFLENFWVPLHLANPASIARKDLKAKGWKGSSWTFEVAYNEKTRVRLGVCQGVREGYYYAYYGVDPCDKLQERAAPTKERVPPEVTLDADLASLVDLFYIPPGKRLEANFHGVRAQVQSNSNPEEKSFSLNVLLKRGDPLPWVLLKNYDILAELWQPDRQVDLSSLVMGVGVQQAIYQEPGLMTLGPPGLLGMMPPSYFLGLPFSLAPTPPIQLREAFLAPEDAP